MNPISVSYTGPQEYTNFVFSNFSFLDIAMEGKSLLELKPMKFTGVNPS